LSKHFNLTHWSIAPQPIGWFNEMSFFNVIDQESGIRIYLGNPDQIKITPRMSRPITAKGVNSEGPCASRAYNFSDIGPIGQ
jgi:hypothetical protein